LTFPNRHSFIVRSEVDLNNDWFWVQMAERMRIFSLRRCLSKYFRDFSTEHLYYYSLL
jgi:hypothetical protein